MFIYLLIGSVNYRSVAKKFLQKLSQKVLFFASRAMNETNVKFVK